MKAKKDPQILIEPVKTGSAAAWEGHHATNPCSIRFRQDRRVFLGYRAGGTADTYQCDQWKVWASHLGLAVLDEYGETITCRLPLPIYRLNHDVKLPQTLAEYHDFMKGPDASRILVLHDFRFIEYRDYLYLVFHEGPLNDCYDCVVRMPVNDFLRRIEQSLLLAGQPVENIRQSWHELWWAPGVWEPCGLNGTNRIFHSKVCKGDIIYYELADGTLQMCHRPLAFGTAILNTGTVFYVEPTADGITRYGVFESNTRPGYLDNSHIGNNGRPTLLDIGGHEVYLDVTHGCSRDMATSRVNKPHIMYYAYLRLKDPVTGELLYYSEDPIIDYGTDWDRYALEGEWVRTNAALRGVMFAGGQEPRVPGRNGLDDEWVAYIGLGDTAVGLARFTPRELIPPAVIKDLQTREVDRRKPVSGLPRVTMPLPERINGWDWSIRANPDERRIEVVRGLPGTDETAVRTILSRPGYFDAHGLVVPENGIRFDQDLNVWVVVYQGLRLLEGQEGKRTQAGYGIVLLWGANPEQILYRSMLPVAVEEVGGWCAASASKTTLFLREYKTWVPSATLSDIAYLNAYLADNVPFPSQMAQWQRQKARLA